MTFEIKQHNNAIFNGFPSLDNISLSKKSFIDFIMKETEKLKEKMKNNTNGTEDRSTGKNV